MAKQTKNTSKSKKLLFAILAAVLLILFVAVYFIGRIIIGYDVTLVPHLTSDVEKEPAEITTEEKTTYSGGDKDVDYFLDEKGRYVPDYETVDENEYDPALFYTENGRVFYDSPNARYGIDISSHQGEVDWEKVAAAGVDYAILRAAYRGYGSSGSLNEDECFKKNAEEATAAGVRIGAYIFSQAINVEEAKEEAEFVLDLVHDYTVEYPIVFDWEPIQNDDARTDNVTTSELTDIAVAFCQRIEQAGYHSAVYLNTSQGYMVYDLEQISKFHIWLADYDEKPDFYYTFDMWQYTNSGEIDGVTGSVDLNISFKDFAA